MRIGFGEPRWTARDESRLGRDLCILATLYIGGHIIAAVLRSRGWF